MVAGIVFNDVNSNGIQEVNEVGIPNTTVVLSGDVLAAEASVNEERSAEQTRTTVTDAAGVYLFANVPLGQYTLRFEVPPEAGAISPPPVTLNVDGSGGTINVPSVAAPPGGRLYLPLVKR